MINRNFQTKLFAFGAVLMPFAAVSNAAMAAEETTLADTAAPVSDAELSDMRGGYFVAAGAKFDFGASVRTLINGELALQTSMQWTPAGAITQQLASLGPAIQAQVAASLAKSGIGPAAVATGAAAAVAGASAAVADVPVAGASVPSAPVADAPHSALPATGVAEAAPANAAPASPSAEAPPALVAGVQVPGATGGATQAFANLGGGQLQNFVINTASGQTIVQNTNVVLTIYNFQAWQQQMAVRSLSTRLNGDMLAAAGFGAGR